MADDHSRPQSPSFLGHVGYKLSLVALGTRMADDDNVWVHLYGVFASYVSRGFFKTALCMLHSYILD